MEIQLSKVSRELGVQKASWAGGQRLVTSSLLLSQHCAAWELTL